MTKERILIAVMAVIIIWFATAIVRLESYHYASQVGMCDKLLAPDKLVERDQCLSTTETRTNPFWHLLYGLRIL